MEEIWRDVRAYEGLYKVSNLGNVKSLNWRNSKTERNLWLKPHKEGYLQVELAKNGKRKCFMVHRLVAEAFVANENNLPIVNHKDEDKKNNNSENLEWCTQGYNVSYSMKAHPERTPKNGFGRAGCRYKGDHIGKRIEQVTQDGNVIATWENSRTIFLETGMSDWSISECCRGHRKNAYGYKWRYTT